MINRVVLVGRLTKDPVLRKTNTQVSVATFTLAVNRRFSTQQETDFINCVAWRQSADFISQYGRKGALVGLEGRIQTRNYDDATGKRIYITEVVADTVQLLESKAVSSSRSSDGYQDSYTSQGSGYYPDNSPMSMDDYTSGPSLDISSDDLPF